MRSEGLERREAVFVLRYWDMCRSSYAWTVSRGDLLVVVNVGGLASSV
jgi:hypothetical protein